MTSSAQSKSDRPKLFMPQRLNDCSGMGMGRNGKSLMGIPWEWELMTKLGMGMGRNGKQPAWEWEKMET